MSFVTERAAPRLDNAKKSNRVAFVARAVGSAAALVIFFLAITWAARSGVISLLTVYAAKTNQVAAANAALSLNASDADAHFVRGAILETKADLVAAIVDYKQAIRARPAHYVLWLRSEERRVGKECRCGGGAYH